MIIRKKLIRFLISQKRIEAIRTKIKKRDNARFLKLHFIIGVIRVY